MTDRRYKKIVMMDTMLFFFVTYLPILIHLDRYQFAPILPQLFRNKQTMNDLNSMHRIRGRGRGVRRFINTVYERKVK